MSEIWSPLPYAAWHDTLDTLHMYMQIVGKVKLALCPFRNQWWEVAFYITPRGMTTGRIPYKEKAFAIDFDFINHDIVICMDDGTILTIPLRPMSVAAFYKEFFKMLETLGISLAISAIPVEFVHPIPFPKDDRHHAYDKQYVTSWWHILLQTSFIFDRFQSSFRGKSSPIHFFWGSFDLASTRFSGKMATPPKAKGIMNHIMKLSENEENFTFGFWPGDKKFQEPAYYSYLYPAPKGYESMRIKPTTSYVDTKMSLCILPYEKLRKAKNPEKEIMTFLTTTYEKSATLAKWNVQQLRMNKY